MEASQSLAQQTGKNVFYEFATRLVDKIGGLIFTIILARMLMPELFGVYTLVLSITIIALVFTDLGLGNAVTRYVSEYLGKKDYIRARSYFRFLLKFKIILVLSAIFVLALISKFIAYDVFEKPVIFVPLLASLFYMLASSIWGFFETLFVSLKKLDRLCILQIVYQLSRILFVILAVMFLSENFVVGGIFIGMGISFLIILILNFIFLGKNKSIIFGKKIPIQRRRVFSYVESMSIVSLSLIFFGSIDTIMLGKFVALEYLGYYRVALSLVLTTSALFGFSNILLPLFTQLHGDQREKAFEKIFR